MRLWGVMLSVAVFAGGGSAQTLSGRMQHYKSTEGVKAVVTNGGVELSWQGERGQELRARFTLRDGQPSIEELAARKAAGAWIVLGKNLTPEFDVTTGQIGRAH